MKRYRTERNNDYQLIELVEEDANGVPINHLKSIMHVRGKETANDIAEALNTARETAQNECINDLVAEGLISNQDLNRWKFARQYNIPYNNVVQMINMARSCKTQERKPQNRIFDLEKTHKDFFVELAKKAGFVNVDWTELGPVLYLKEKDKNVEVYLPE